jgi:hypothetical protein
MIRLRTHSPRHRVPAIALAAALALSLGGNAFGAPSKPKPKPNIFRFPDAESTDDRHPYEIDVL